MAGRTVSREIEAEAATLWSLVSDLPRMGEWSPENRGGRWLDGATGPAVGARFRGTNRRGPARWTTICEIVASEPGRELAFTAGLPRMPRTLWRYRFEPVGSGRTRVTESFELPGLTAGVTGVLHRLTLGRFDRAAELESGMRDTLDRLAAAVAR